MVTLPRLSLSQRISTAPSTRSDQRNPSKELSPLATRLLLALNQLASEHDELTVPIKGFERYMRRSSVPDDTIRDSLNTVRQYITVILDDADADSDNAVSA